MSTIDIGADAIDRTGVLGPGNTHVTLDNPANAGGTITSVEIWCNSDMSGVRVGTFFLVSGTTYQCRDSAVIGNVTSGSKQTFPVSIEVRAGDYIGIYHTGGNIDRTIASGTDGYAYKVGEYIDPGDSASYTVYADYAVSLHGTGETTTTVELSDGMGMGDSVEASQETPPPPPPPERVPASANAATAIGLGFNF